MNRKMKLSTKEWIGQIPSEWGCGALLTQLRSKITDGPHETPSLVDENEGIPFVSVDSVNSTKNLDFSVVKKYISEADYLEYSKKARLEIGDVLFTKAASIGKTAIVGNEKFMVWSPIAILKTDSSKYFNEFLYYVLNCDGAIEFARNILGNETTQVNVGMRALEKTPIPIPPISEQNAIVQYLDSKCTAIDKAIDWHKKIIEKQTEYETALISHAVINGLHITKKKSSGYELIGDIPETWNVLRLRFIGNTTNGISKGGEHFGHGSPFVSYSDVYKHIELPDNIEGLVDSTKDEQQRYSVQKGDIFFTRTSETVDEVGFSSVCTKTIPNATFAGFLIRVRPFNNYLEPSYAKYYFRGKHLRDYFAREMDITTRASLSQNFLKNVPVVIPPKKEQIEIAEYLDEVCKKISFAIQNHKIIVNKLEEYRKSVIYHAVTGKIDCREVTK